jgi:hypothetical protein
MPTSDGFADGANTWANTLGDDPSRQFLCPNNQQQCSKKEYIMGVFADYQTGDGDPVYPAQQIDFRANYFKNDMWEDGAEKFLAFNHLAMHRTRAIPGSCRTNPECSPGGAAAAFVVSTSSLAALKVRANFAKLGADMYFSESGEPIMIVTPHGDKIWRSEASDLAWQYWKFVWRSSMFLYITLIDHLWMTHYSAGNALTAAAREALAPAHPLRRLLTMATWGSIDVNSAALHQLIGPNHLLQRSSPFHDFHEVAEAAHTAIPSMKEAYGAFVDEVSFASLDPTLQKMPFYADGKLVFAAISDLVDKWSAIYSSDWCDGNGLVKDADIKMLLQRIQTWSLFDRSATSDNAWLGLYTSSNELVCAGFYKWLKIMLFAVSGYHRHVGTVADIASDPEFASFSNVVGEAFARPRQHLQMALIAGSTARSMPKLEGDSSFLASGLGADKFETQARQSLKDFQSAMTEVAAEIDGRNQNKKERPFPYLQMHPKYVESSVAV